LFRLDFWQRLVIDEAIAMAKEISKKVYISEGASGHSATNTLWFISTRKKIP
jgi:hypothetical protein